MEKHLPPSKLNWTRYITSMLLLLFFAGFCSSIQAQTVTTDKSDYAPGDIVNITGRNFQANEIVTITISHIEPGIPIVFHEHKTWTVTANVSGYFETTWSVDDVELNTTLLLVASGDLGSEANCTFTDASSTVNSISVNFSSGTPTYGTVGSVNYDVKITPTSGSANGQTTLSLIGTSLPSDATYSWSLNPVPLPKNKSDVITITLTIFSTSLMPAGTTTGIIVKSTEVSPPRTINSNTFNFIIGKSDATVTVTGYTGVYDAAAHGADGTANGVNGEDLSSLLHLGNSFTNAPGGTASWTFDGNANYKSSSGTVSIVITKADATVTVTGYTGVYDAAAHGATGTATGVSAVDLSSGLNLGATFTDVPGGTANWTFTGGTNYLDESGDVAIDISKADALVTVNGYTGVYDAAAHGATGTATGVSAVDLSSGLNLGATFTDVPGGTANWTFTGGTNYLDESGDVAIDISKADALVTVNGYTGTYDAVAHGATGTAKGVLSETLAGLDLGASFTNVPGGTANWAFTDVTGNYNDKNGSVAIVINKRPITITADAKSKYCGQIDPTLTYQITSGTLVNNDSFSGSLIRAIGDCAGTYAILQGTVALSTNYNLSYIGNNLTINGVLIDAAASNATFPVGGAATLTAKVLDLLSNPVPGVPVIFTLDNSSTIYTDITDDFGIASTSVSGLIVDVYKVTAVAGSGCATNTAYLAIYDPNGGFVTGGGWFTSPVNASCQYMQVSGKANFGFVSQYKKGSNIPSGNTEFQFHAGNLNFSSTSYDKGSLVVAGSQAIYKGVGTINGTGSYGFMVSAVDGQVNGGGNIDKFRIKIWDKLSGAIVYDNNLGMDDNGVPTTSLGGGSIVIHKPDNTKGIIGTEVAVQNPEVAVQNPELDLKVYPNPFADHLYFELNTVADAKAMVEIFDISGHKVATIFNENVETGQSYQFEYVPENGIKGFFIYRLSFDGQLIMTGKVIRK